MSAKSLTAAEYDAIAESYESIVETIPIRLIYQHNLKLRFGDIRGLDVLDLACGPGVYTREFRQMGARRVVGIDISSEQIRLAQEREAQQKLGIEYLVGDVAEIGKLGEFDLVSAAMLLHYSPTREFLARACRSIAENLKPGRRFVTVNMNPAVKPGTIDAQEYKKYHVSGEFEGGFGEGSKVLITLDWRGQRVQFHNWYYGMDTYQQVLTEAGFRNIRWHAPIIPNEFLNLGKDHWELYLRCPILLVLECET